MTRPKKTKANPYGLTIKQEATIQDIVEGVKKGKGINLQKSHLKAYNTSSKASASTIASENLNRLNYRKALLASLRQKNIIGIDSKVEQRLCEGLDATKKESNGNKSIDYTARLKYIKELNKIIGMYAPEQKQVKRLSLNVDMSGKELDSRIEQLQEELRRE